MEALTIEAIERDFPNQWLLVQVTETRDGAPFRGIVVKASTSRDEVVREIAANKDKGLFFFFSGITATPETAFALHYLLR
ncbi:MAG: hypothetical protein ACE5JO_00710 [Candidatus Binatia bacterium]